MNKFDANVKSVPIDYPNNNNRNLSQKERNENSETMVSIAIIKKMDKRKTFSTGL